MYVLSLSLLMREFFSMTIKLRGNLKYFNREYMTVAFINLKCLSEQSYPDYIHTLSIIPTPPSRKYCFIDNTEIILKLLNYQLQAHISFQVQTLWSDIALLRSVL